MIWIIYVLIGVLVAWWVGDAESAIAITIMWPLAVAIFGTIWILDKLGFNIR